MIFIPIVGIVLLLGVIEQLFIEDLHLAVRKTAAWAEEAYTSQGSQLDKRSK